MTNNDFFMFQVVIGLFFGLICCAIAASKGRSAIGWFIGGCLLGLIALIIVICLSDLNKEEAARKKIADEQNQLRDLLQQQQQPKSNESPDTPATPSDDSITKW